MKDSYMVAAPPPPLILGGDLKISDQNNLGGPEQKVKFKGELNLRGDLKYYREPMKIVDKGGHTPPFLDHPPPLSRNPRCPHLRVSHRCCKHRGRGLLKFDGGGGGG